MLAFVSISILCTIYRFFVANSDHSDQHTVSRHVVKDSGSEFSVRNEGFFRAHIGSGKSFGATTSFSVMGNTFGWYDVPFGVMVPANSEQARNLLVPVCISASSVAYSSSRIENMFMDLGSAAGVAVATLLQAVSASGGTKSCPELTVQDDVNITEVQEVLSRVYKQRFHGPASHSDLASVSRG